MTNLSEKKVIFENRRDAGRQLAAALTEYADQPVVVFGIPNGGVPMALEVASALKAEFGLIISRKIPMPLNPEAGFGAIADDGTMVLDEAAVKQAGLTRQQIEFEANRVRACVKQRSLLYKGDRPLVSVNGKTVIIVDDGLASGFTTIAAVQSVKYRRPKQVIVAVPVASAIALQQVEKVADRVIACITGVMPRFYISDFYRHWQDVSDNEVLECLQQWRLRRMQGL